jgi:hypothetical protein
MKTTLSIVFGIFLAGFCSLSADVDVPLGALKLTHAQVPQV